MSMTSSRAVRLRTGLSIVASAMIAVASPAVAASVVQRFNIPAGDAATALRLFAQQSGRQLLFPYDAVAGRKTSAVIGQFPADAVLAKLAGEAGLVVAGKDGATTTLVPTRPQPAATAADPPQDIVVTATKRPENIRDVPIAITALREQDLQRLGATSTEEAMRFVPGVNFSSNGANSVNYTIRGVNTGSTTGNVQSTIALYVDDLSVLDPYYPKVTTNLRLFDVQRVEVLRGPQGTLFGSSALGGAIRVITNKPDSHGYHAAGEFTIASTDGGDATYRANAMVNVPVKRDLLAVRLVGYYDRIGGYVDDTRTGATNTNRTISEGGRAEARLTPLPGLTLIATALIQKDDPKDAGYTFYAGGGYTFNNYTANRFPQTLKIYSLNGEYDAGFATITTITTFSDKTEKSQIDFSARTQALVGIAAVTTIDDYGPSNTFQQEVRLASNSRGRLHWLIGGTYSNNRRTILEQVDVPGAGAKYASVGYPSDLVVNSDSQRRTRESAIFGELSYDLTEQLKLTAGLRAFHNSIDVVQLAGGYLNRTSPPLLTQNSKETAVTPKFAISYRAASNVTFYAQAAKGYRIGQPNVVTIAVDSISGERIPTAYNSDSLWNYEIGAKTSFLDGRVTINAAAYYIDWKNIQLASRTAGLGLNYISNAGDATIKGFELELRAAPSGYVELGTALSTLDSRMTAVRNGAAALVGDKLPASAPITDTTFVELHAPIGRTRAYLRADVHYVGKQYATLYNPTSLIYGDYAELGLRAGVIFSRMELAAFVTNLTNGTNIESALTVQGVNVAIRQRPRTIGLTLRTGF